MAPEPLPFPNLRPGEDSAVPPTPQDIADALERTIERMKRSLDELESGFEDVYRMPDLDDEPPAAA